MGGMGYWGSSLIHDIFEARPVSERVHYPREHGMEAYFAR